MGYNIYQYNSPLYVSDKLKLVTVKGVLDGGGEDECVICCTKIAGKLVTATGARIEKIIESSHKRGDDITRMRYINLLFTFTFTFTHPCISATSI